jgi:hypothetical protein
MLLFIGLDLDEESSSSDEQEASTQQPDPPSDAPSGGGDDAILNAQESNISIFRSIFARGNASIGISALRDAAIDAVMADEGDDNEGDNDEGDDEGDGINLLKRSFEEIED